MRTWAMARKEFIHIFRDPRSLGMGIAIPMIMLILFGYALTLDVDKVPIVIWDQNRSQVSRELVSRFLGSRYFSLQGLVNNYREVEEAIDSRRALASLIIPPDFSGRLASGRKAPLQLIIDGSDSNTATIAMGYAEGITMSFNQDIALKEIQRQGGRAVESPIDFHPRVWFNADLESRNYIIPGLIAVIMMVIAALLTSLTVAREWEQGTMEQLISTPVKAPELILGKLFPYFCIGMFDVLLAVLMGEFLFHVPLRGNVALIFGLAAVFDRDLVPWPVHQHCRQKSIAGQPDSYGGHLSAVLFAFRFSLSHTQYAQGAARDLLFHSGQVFHHPLKRDLFERRRSQDSGCGGRFSSHFLLVDVYPG